MFGKDSERSDSEYKDKSFEFLITVIACFSFLVCILFKFKFYLKYLTSLGNLLKKKDLILY